MHQIPKFTSVRLALVLATALAATTSSSHAQSAIDTISATPDAVAGSFDYTITLQNTSTGGLNLNSFWDGWTAQMGNTMPSDPTSAANNLGWANDLFANSIMWKNTTGTALAPGATGVFTFVSTSAPSAIETAPASDGVVYVNGIDFSQGTLGDSSDAFAPTVVATPEPSTWGMLTAGLLLLGATRKSFAAARKLAPTQK